MTIRIPKQPDTAADRLLRLMGKSRAYVLPDNRRHPRHRDVYAVCLRESFWRALVRPKSNPLPSGLISATELEKLNETPN